MTFPNVRADPDSGFNAAEYAGFHNGVHPFLSHLLPARVGFGAHVCYHCRISPPRFLAECRKRRLNQGSLFLLFFRLFALSDLYLVFVCLFSCTALFVSISQVIGCEDRLRNDLYCVGWGVKLCSTNPSPSPFASLSSPSAVSVGNAYPTSRRVGYAVSSPMGPRRARQTHFSAFWGKIYISWWHKRQSLYSS